MKRKIFFFLTLFFITFPFDSQAVLLQLKYPKINLPGIGVFDINPNISLHDFSRYIYYFFVIIGGIVAFSSLIYGSFLWLISAGNPARVSRAKDQILASFLGLILLLSSWVILYIIDPQFVILPVFNLGSPTPQPSQRVFPTTLTNGFIFTITDKNNNEVLKIPVERAELRVEDTQRFPYFGGAIDLSGQGKEGLKLQRVEFFNPWDLATCQRVPNTGVIIAGSCQTLYYHGIICFTQKNFTGRAKVCASATGDNICELVLDGNQPCLSLISFQQPRIPVYKSGDEIIFYEKPLPVAKDPKTGEVAEKACLKIDKIAGPENCLTTCNLLEQGKGIFRIQNQNCQAVRSLSGMIGIRNLFGKSIDKDGNSRSWNPRSMEVMVSSSRKYLILLFNEENNFEPVNIGGQKNQKDELGLANGLAYTLYYNAENFEDPSDDRMYWARQTDNFLPKSALILPLQPLK